MDVNVADNNTNGSSPGPAGVTLGMPKEMDVANMCRGMQTGWPQLTAAMRYLMDDPLFRVTFQNSYASTQGLSIGGPQQLLATLMVDPAWLNKPTPPGDVYAWSVWLTKQGYEAARNISITIRELPGLLLAAKRITPFEAGALVKEVLDGKFGLAQAAGNIAGLATNLANYLQTMGGDLEGAQNAYQEIGAVLEQEKVVVRSENRMKIIGAHPDAKATTHEITNQLIAFEGAAAKVTAFAVITNMAEAMQAIAEGWQATQKQFETVAGYDPENLGDINFLQDSLKLDSAVGEWSAFADIVQNYMKRALMIR